MTGTTCPGSRWFKSHKFTAVIKDLPLSASEFNAIKLRYSEPSDVYAAARLLVRHIPVAVYCARCGAIIPLDQKEQPSNE